MDAIVRQAMAKWPNVPACYGWLALDARGGWRMRDAATQAAGGPGERLAHPALIGFIERNYAADEQGRWHFQNGPQRVFVDLEIAPFVARTDPRHGFALHTGAPAGRIDGAAMTGDGRLVLGTAQGAAAVDDRDMGQVLERLRLGNAALDDEGFTAWLGGDAGLPPLTLRLDGRPPLTVERIALDEIEKRFGFVRRPRPEAGAGTG